jgi:protein tyrosine/serine phosphatase
MTARHAEDVRARRFRASRIIPIAAVMLAIIWVVWIKQVKPYFVPRNFGVVKEGAIYRSGKNTPRMLRHLCADLDIRTIVNLGRSSAECGLAAELGVNYYEFDLPGDGTGDAEKWVEVLSLIADPDRQPVLVHCDSGAQRTTTAVMLYRVIVQGQTITDSYPESFEFKHEADEWLLLAYIADNLDRIRDGYARLTAGEAPGGHD